MKGKVVLCISFLCVCVLAGTYVFINGSWPGSLGSLTGLIAGKRKLAISEGICTNRYIEISYLHNL